MAAISTTGELLQVFKLIGLGAEYQLLSGLVQVVQGFYAKAVACQPECLLGFIPKGKGPKAIEAMQAIPAPSAVGCQQYFRIGISGEGMSQAAQLIAQLYKVEQLSVEDNRKVACGIMHGLCPQCR